MSQENVELARRGYEALNDGYKTGDFVPALEEFIDPQAVLVPSGVMPESSEMRGHDGVLRFLSIQTEALDDFWIEPQEFLDAGDKVVVPIRFGGRAAHTGIDVEFEVVHVCTVSNGKWTRLDMYVSRAEALQAAGLEE